jgi:hypothetical protein
MKKVMAIIGSVGLLALAVFAAHDTTLTERELRDPKQLRPWLTGNAGANAEVFTNSVSVGSFAIYDSTQLVFITSGSVTNVIDGDIDTP